MGFPHGAAEPGYGQRSRSRRGLGMFLGMLVLGSLLPGAGVVAAGQRWGWYLIAGWAGLISGMVAGAIRLGPEGLIELGTDSERLRTLAPILLVIASGWLVSAVLGFYLLESARMPVLRRASGAVTVILAASLVVGPIVLAARNLDTQGRLLDKVFASSEGRSLTAPDDTVTVEDRWDGIPRLNVLLLGSDAGPGRDGVRPDTIILASIDTRSGDTVLFSLPRNLQRVPFPEYSPLAAFYPNGFIGFGDVNEYLLNAVFRNVPALHPDIFEGSAYPGADATKWAVEGALGIDVQYFVMVNLEGFEQMVDALGGVTIDVHFRIPIGTRLNSYTGRCTEPRGWIEPGLNQHLDGGQALWYARARCGPPPVSDDYDRMERQRCMIGAIADQASPMNLLRNYQSIASATENLIVTDIPQQLLPALVDLGRTVQEEGTISSLAFTNDVLVPANPDYERLRALVAEALASPPAASEPQTDPGSAGGGGGPAGPGVTDPGADEPGADEPGVADSGVTGPWADDGVAIGEPVPGTIPQQEPEPEAETLATVC